MEYVVEYVLRKRNVIWKYPSLYQDTYGSCNLQQLNPGLIISTSPRIVSLISSESQYQALCSKNKLLLSALNRKLTENGIEKLPILSMGWDDFISTDYQFIYTVYPIIYSISCCTFISCFLAIIIFTKQYLRSQKPTGLIKISSLLTCLFLIAIYIFSLVRLYNQHRQGVSSGEILINSIQNSVPFNVVDLIIVILLQLSQVQIIMRLFPRQKEKRFTFIVGIFLSISSQAIWSVSTFVASNDRLGTDPDYDSTIAILPAFVYLLRIAMSVLFSCLFVVYFFNKRQFIFNPKMLPLTFFTFIIINSSFAIFIADISNIWVSELSELFNVTSYVVSNVVTWEFINRVILLEKVEQKKGILGRQFYDEEDQYYLDSFGNAVDKNRIIRKGKYDLIITSHDKDKPILIDNRELEISTSNQQSSMDSDFIEKKSCKNRKLSTRFNDFAHNVGDFTDKLVEMSLSVPIRGGSSLSNSSLYDTELSKPGGVPDFLSRRLGKKKSTEEETQSTTRNQNVFIYQQKEIKFDQSLERLMRKTRKRRQRQRQLESAVDDENTHVNHHAQVRFQIDEDNNNNINLNNESYDEEDGNEDDDVIAEQLGEQEEEIIYDEGSYDFDDDDDDDGEEEEEDNGN